MAGVLIFATSVLASALSAAGPLTNAEVLKLSKLGLGEKVVIAKIKQAPQVSFQLEIEDLEKLRKSGVSAAIIAAMLERSTGGGTGSGTGAFSADGNAWLSGSSGIIQLDGIAGYVEASIGQAFKQAFLFSFTNKFAIIARGTKANARLSGAPTTLYTRYNPSEIGIARLTVQPENDRRYIWVVHRKGSNQGEFHPKEDDITFSHEKTPEGVFKLTPTKPLSPGEYGLIAAGGSTGYLIHDFGVEEE